MVGYILSPHPDYQYHFSLDHATIDPPFHTNHPYPRIAMDPNNPRETWSRIQKAISRASQQPGGKAPKGVLGGGATLILLGAAWVTFNSAIFNGAENFVFLEADWNGDDGLRGRAFG